MEPVLSVGFFLFLIFLGLFVGGMTEKNHLKQLQLREDRLRGILLTQLKSFPSCAASPRIAPTMLVAEVVISSDYLKSFLAGWRNLFGGEVRSFRSLLERARREAICKIQEQAQLHGYNAVCNVRLETADIGGRGSNRKNKIVMVSILASGTAYCADASGNT